MSYLPFNINLQKYNSLFKVFIFSAYYLYILF